MICYLAGPIDLAPKDGQNWKLRLLELCKGEDFNFYDPVGPFKIHDMSPSMVKYIHDLNMFALDNADALVGYLVRGVTSVGTPIEFYCTAGRKPMFIITDLEESVYMQFLRTKGNVVFCKTVEELYSALVEYANSRDAKAG